MDIKEICKEDIIAVGNDSSFEEDIGEINDIFQKKSPKDFNLHLENEKNSSNDKIENIFENKYFEEAELDEIYNVLNEINQAVTIDVNSTTKKDYYRSNSMNEPKINAIKENHLPRLRRRKQRVNLSLILYPKFRKEIKGQRHRFLLPLAFVVHI